MQRLAAAFGPGIGSVQVIFNECRLHRPDAQDDALKRGPASNSPVTNPDPGLPRDSQHLDLGLLGIDFLPAFTGLRSWVHRAN
jgi:hypothetical protein